MRLAGAEKETLRQAILTHFDEATLRMCLSDMSKDLDHVAVTRGTLIERVDELLRVAAREDWLDDLARQLKRCNPARTLHAAIDGAFGAAAKEGPERWAAWLEQMPPLRVDEVNPYHPFTLNLTKAELGDAYRYPEVEKIGAGERASLPPYVRRRADERIDAVFAERRDQGAFVVLVGASKSGKSRTAYEALLRHVGNRRLLIPRGEAGAGRVLDRFADLAVDLRIAAGGAVLWLDNLHDALTEEHLLAGAEIDRVLRRLVEDHRLVVMATIWDSRYNAFFVDAASDAAQVDLAARQLGRRLLEWAKPTTVELAPRSAAGFATGTIETHYPRAGFPEVWAALDRGDGLAEALITWPRMREAFKHGPASRKAILRAAVDLRRAGIATPIPKAALAALFPIYLRDEGEHKALSVDEAINTARETVGRYQHLLEPGADGTYAPYDRLIYYLDEPDVRDNYPLLDPVWEEALRLCGADASSLRPVGVAAYSRKKATIAERAWRAGMELGDGGAAHNLGVLLNEQGQSDEAERVYRKGMELGHGRAAHNLGRLLNKQGRSDEAELAYRKGMDLGEGSAANNLGVLLNEQGKSRQAEEVFRKGMELGEGSAAYNLGVLLRKQGKSGEAEQAYRKGMELGEGSAANNLGVLLNQQGKSGEAEWAFREGMKLGHGRATHNLGVLLVKQGKSGEAEQAYRKGMDLGHGRAAFNLGLLLALDNRIPEAVDAFATALRLLETNVDDEVLADKLRPLRDAIGPEAFETLTTSIAAKQQDVP